MVTKCSSIKTVLVGFVRTAGVVLAMGTAAMAANADTRVYLYEGGVPVDVTATVVVQNPYVVHGATVIGVIDAFDFIRDPVTNAIIGLIEEDE